MTESLIKGKLKFVTEKKILLSKYNMCKSKTRERNRRYELS